MKIIMTIKDYWPVSRKKHDATCEAYRREIKILHTEIENKERLHRMNRGKWKKKREAMETGIANLKMVNEQKLKESQNSVDALRKEVRKLQDERDHYKKRHDNAVDEAYQKYQSKINRMKRDLHEQYDAVLNPLYAALNAARGFPKSTSPVSVLNGRLISKAEK